MPDHRKPLTSEERQRRNAKAAQTRAENKAIRTAVLRAAAAAKRANADRMKKLDKLRKMTTDRGCSAHEAEAAQAAYERLSTQPKVVAEDMLDARYRTPPLPRTWAEWEAARKRRR